MRRDAGETLTDRDLRMTALAIATESAVVGVTTGGILIAAWLVYEFLAGGTVVAVDGMVKVVRPEEAATRH